MNANFIKIKTYCQGNDTKKVCFDDIQNSNMPNVIINIQHIVSISEARTWGYCTDNEKYSYKILVLDNNDFYLIPLETAEIIEERLFE